MEKKIELDLIASYTTGKNDINNNYHSHSIYEVFSPINGNSTFYIEGNRYDLSPGDFLCINSDEKHKLPNKDDMSNIRLTIAFNPDYMRFLSTKSTDLLYCFEKRNPGENNLLHFENPKLKKILEISDRIVNLNYSNQYGNDVYSTAELTRLLIELNLEFLKMKTYSPNSTSNKLSPIIKYINLHYNENLSLESISHQLCVHKNYINQTLKAELNTTFHRYLTTVRISQAKSLIETGHSLIDVCFLCGFQNYASFFRAFKSETGYSPIDYKKTY